MSLDDVFRQNKIDEFFDELFRSPKNKKSDPVEPADNKVSATVSNDGCVEITGTVKTLTINGKLVRFVNKQ